MKDNHQEHDRHTKDIITKNVKEYGCHIAMIEADNYMPAFLYSIGLYKKFGHPEIICFGLKVDVMASMINHALSMIKAGQKFIPNKSYTGFLEGVDVQFVEVDKHNYPYYLGYATWFYSKSFWFKKVTVDFPVIQLVWPDKKNIFPWEPEFNSDWKFKQPLLDRNVDFKFYEERNLGVYTTKQAFEGHPILYVYHNMDGDWQFHTSDNPSLDDAKLVCLEHLTQLDPSLNDIYHLQYGWNAWRASHNDEWQYEQGTEEEEDENDD